MNRTLKKSLLWGTLSLGTAFAAAACLEWDGYNVFDRKNGENILCTLDPSCRNLTPGEIRMAKTVFGNQLEYNRVKIFNRNYFYIVGETKCSLSPNGNIYLGEGPGHEKDFSQTELIHQKHFIHEATHVWQWQNGVDVRSEAISTFLENHFNYKAAYKYDVNEDSAFSTFNLEQQAVMVESYYGVKDKMGDALARKAPAAELDQICRDLAPLERKISSIFFIQKEPVCQAIKLPKLHPKKRLPKPPPVSFDITAPLPETLSFCGK